MNDVAIDSSAIMLGRIVKFRRGDQYEEMQGRDVAGKTVSSQAGTNVSGRDQQNQQPDGGGKSMAAPLDTTPDGTWFHAVYDRLPFSDELQSGVPN